MHYHLLLTDAEGDRPYGRVFPTQGDAEREIPTMFRLLDDITWSPKRYPGRSSRRFEIAVYLDRDEHGSSRHEVSLLRCPCSGADPDPQCYFWGRGPQKHLEARTS